MKYFSLWILYKHQGRKRTRTCQEKADRNGEWEESNQRLDEKCVDKVILTLNCQAHTH